jgi:hypothetical protein
MLFESRFWVGTDKKEWVLSIHANPHAHLPLPPELDRLANGNRFSLSFNLAIA